MTDTATDNSPQSPQTGAKGIPIADIIEFKKKGLTHQQIANLLGCDKSNVTKRLGTIKEELESLDNFTKHKSATMEFIQQRLLDSITPEKIKEATLQQTATSFGIIYDKQRLQDGKSTENLDFGNYGALVNELQEVNRQIEELEKREQKVTGKVTEDEVIS